MGLDMEGGSGGVVASGLLPPAPSRTHSLERCSTHALSLLVWPECVVIFAARKQQVSLVSQFQTVRKSGPASALGLMVEGLDPRDPLLQSERMQNFAADPDYWKGEVFAYVGPPQNLKDLKGVDLLLGMEGCKSNKFLGFHSFKKLGRGDRLLSLGWGCGPASGHGGLRAAAASGRLPPAPSAPAPGCKVLTSTPPVTRLSSISGGVRSARPRVAVWGLESGD